MMPEFVTADSIAATIRQMDGSNVMGAGALGEVIADFVNEHQVIAAALSELANDAMQRAIWPSSTREFVAAYLRTSADIHVTA